MILLLHVASHSEGCESGSGWAGVVRLAIEVSIGSNPSAGCVYPGHRHYMCSPSPPACQESWCQAHFPSWDGIQPGREHSFFLLLLLLHLFGCVVRVSGFIVCLLALLTGSVRVRLPRSVLVGAETHRLLINIHTFSS